MEITGPPPRRLLWRIGAPRVHVVEVLDVSVTGALVRGERWDGFEVGAVLPIRLHTHRGRARVVRREPEGAGRKAPVRYALELVDVDPKLWAEFSSIVGQELHPEGDPAWHERHDE
jgi:hypothetical protein